MKRITLKLLSYFFELASMILVGFVLFPEKQLLEILFFALVLALFINGLEHYIKGSEHPLPKLLHQKVGYIIIAVQALMFVVICGIQISYTALTTPIAALLFFAFISVRIAELSYHKKY